MEAKSIWIWGGRIGCQINNGDRVWVQLPWNKQFATVIKRNGKLINDVFARDELLPLLLFEDGTKGSTNTDWLWKEYKAKRTWKNLWGLLLTDSYGAGITHFYNEPELLNE